MNSAWAGMATGNPPAGWMPVASASPERPRHARRGTIPGTRERPAQWIADSSTPPDGPGHQARDGEEDERQERRAAQESSHKGEGRIVMSHGKASFAAMPRLLEMSPT